MNMRDIEKLPKDEQAVLRASHCYYRALLQGASAETRQRLRRVWLQEVRQRWPETAE